MEELRDRNGLTEAEFLAGYRPGDYKRPSVTADIVVLRRSGGERSILLIRRGGHPCLGRWALPGGFAEEGESLDETAARELREETGLSGLPLEQLRLFSAPERDPRCWTISMAYLARLGEKPENPCGGECPRAGDDADDARWFSLTTGREGETITVGFSAPPVDFSVRLRREREGYTVLSDGGLAFDHALMIAYALTPEI